MPELTPCPVGRSHDSLHATCRTCQISCVPRNAALSKPSPLPEATKPPRNELLHPKPFKLVQQIPPEDVEQVSIARWLDHRKVGGKPVLWCHVPNGGDRDIRVAARLKTHGVKKGFPDVAIYTPPPAYPECVGTAIEMKRRHGGVVSVEQEEWLKNLESCGWLTYVARGWEEAVKFLKEAGY